MGVVKSLCPEGNSKSSVAESRDGLFMDESDGNENKSYAPSRGSAELDDGDAATQLSGDEDDRKFVQADDSSNLLDVGGLQLLAVASSSVGVLQRSG